MIVPSADRALHRNLIRGGGPFPPSARPLPGPCPHLTRHSPGAPCLSWPQSAAETPAGCPVPHPNLAAPQLRASRRASQAGRQVAAQLQGHCWMCRSARSLATRLPPPAWALTLPSCWPFEGRDTLMGAGPALPHQLRQPQARLTSTATAALRPAFAGPSPCMTAARWLERARLWQGARSASGQLGRPGTPALPIALRLTSMYVPACSWPFCFGPSVHVSGLHFASVPQGKLPSWRCRPWHPPPCLSPPGAGGRPWLWAACRAHRARPLCTHGSQGAACPACGESAARRLPPLASHQSVHCFGATSAAFRHRHQPVLGPPGVHQHCLGPAARPSHACAAWARHLGGCSLSGGAPLRAALHLWIPSMGL